MVTLLTSSFPSLGRSLSIECLAYHRTRRGSGFLLVRTTGAACIVLAGRETVGEHFPEKGRIRKAPIQ